MRGDFRGCRYFVMFRPPSLLAPQIVPTAANTPAGQPGLLRPSRTRFVTSPRIGYANRPTTRNWRYGDLHPARLRPCRLLLSVRPPCHPGQSHLASPVGDHDCPSAIFPVSRRLKRSLAYPHATQVYCTVRWSSTCSTFAGAESGAGAHLGVAVLALLNLRRCPHVGPAGLLSPSCPPRDRLTAPGSCRDPPSREIILLSTSQ